MISVIYFNSLCVFAQVIYSFFAHLLARISENNKEVHEALNISEKFLLKRQIILSWNQGGKGYE